MAFFKQEDWVVVNFICMERGEKTNLTNHQPRHKKSIETTETINDNLPALQPGRGDKANVLRNQLNDTRSQIVLMEAKLRNLRQLKDRHDLINQRNLTRLDFMNNVKERKLTDLQNKQKVIQSSHSYVKHGQSL